MINKTTPILEAAVEISDNLNQIKILTELICAVLQAGKFKNLEQETRDLMFEQLMCAERAAHDAVNEIIKIEWNGRKDDPK